MTNGHGADDLRVEGDHGETRGAQRRAVRATARDVLGHPDLLPGQAEAATAAAAGRDVLALLPTGGGKSAIYQLAGLERDGPTLVVSPLLALQQDQLAALRDRDLPAAALSSTVPEGQREATLQAFGRGELEFLLLAPEQLAVGAVLERLTAARSSLLVVDEAHCVSEWGHDFRPEYRRLGRAREALGGPPILALTATASPPVREDIVRWLGLRDPLIVVRGADRPEIHLAVSRHADAARKRAAILDRIEGESGAGIVYAAARQTTQDVADALRARGVRAEAYHAGLPDRRRREVVGRFMGGETDVVAATIAFGMGVDKPDVRFVLHHDPSDSLEAYHQEIGRAGRDGEPARAELFFDPADLGLRRFQTVPPPLAERDVERLIRRIRGGERDPGRLASTTRLSRRRVDQVVGRLEALEAVVVEPDGAVVATEALADPTLPALVTQEQDRRREIARTRVELLRGYAETTGCRRRYLLNTLGEELDAPCGNCDTCDAGLAEAADDEGGRADGPFALNDAVVHATFGAGVVSRVEADRVGVRFETAGYRTLALPQALDAGLLRPDEDAGRH